MAVSEAEGEKYPVIQGFSYTEAFIIQNRIQEKKKRKSSLDIFSSSFFPKELSSLSCSHVCAFLYY